MVEQVITTFLLKIHGMNPQKKMAVRWLTLEFAGKTLTFAVLKLRLLRRRETEASFCLYNFLRFYYVK